MGALFDAASAGNRLATLHQLRDTLAASIEVAANGSEVATLSRQLTLVLAEIAELEPSRESEGTALDELRRRRAARAPRPKREAKPASK